MWLAIHGTDVYDIFKYPKKSYQQLSTDILLYLLST